MTPITFARGGGAKSAAKGKTANPLAEAAAAIGGSGNCGTGTNNGKRGFQKGNKCAGKDRRNSDVDSKRSAHTAASAHARRTLNSKTATVKDKQRAVKAAKQAGSELRAAREAHAAGKRDARNAARREARAASRPAAASTPKPASKPASDPKVEAKARLDSAVATTKSARAPEAVARVGRSVAEAGSIKVERASANLDAVRTGVKAGAFDKATADKHLDGIARGMTKDELFSAAKAAGIEHSATTKAGLVDHLKGTLAPKPAESAAKAAPDVDAPYKAVREASAAGMKPMLDRAPGTPTPKAAAPGAEAPAARSLPGVDAKQAAHREQVKAIDADHARAADTLAREVGMDPAAYRAAIGDKFRSAVDSGDFYIRASSDALPSILKDGRFKTQFETGTSGGNLDIAGRTKAEAALFGTRPDVDAAARPVYGYVGTSNLAGDSHRGAAAYGDAIIQLKPGVRDRATVTMGDSLARADMVVGAPASSAGAGAVAFGSPTFQRTHREILDHKGDGGSLLESVARNHRYVEAQFHGGVKASDIAHVAFADRPSRSVTRELESRGITWSVTGGGD